jgi:hypothetical protein
VTAARPALRLRRLLTGPVGRLTLTGIWNNLVKPAMPALALTGLVAVRNAPTGPTVAAVLGSVLPLGLGAWLLWSHGAGRMTTSSEPAGVAS